jgi:polar amino acid transport system substrate-binding protein
MARGTAPGDGSGACTPSHVGKAEARWAEGSLSAKRASAPLKEVRPRMHTRASHVLAALTAATVVAATVVSTSMGSDQASHATSAGKQLVACGEGTFPPVEFFTSSHKAVGSELDISKTIAAQGGYTITFHQIQFNGLIPALLAKQCDLIAAGLFYKPERAKVINFAIYSQNGQSIMVRKGNPAGIKGLDDSLAGKRIGMVAGYTTIPAIEAACKKVASHGKTACSVVQFATSTDNDQALKQGKVDAVVDSATSIGYVIKQHPADFQLVPTSLLQPSRVGFGFRKSDTALLALFRSGVTKLYANGTMCKILNKWSIGSTALPPHHC